MATSYSSSTRLPRSMGTCIYPGCDKGRYMDPTSGFVHQFCGRTHAQMYLSPSSLINPQITDHKYTPSTVTTSSSSSSKSLPITSSRDYSSSLGRSNRGGPLKAIHGVLNSITGIGSDRTIRFYESHRPYYEFTNFYPCRVFVDGKTWPTSEHYFQAQKFIGTPFYDHIRTALPSPRDAFQFSRNPSVSRWERKDWSKVKDDVMFKVLAEKFTQHEFLKEKLLSTKDSTLIEHTDRDSYWGDGGDGRGLNKLGNLLMKVREILQEKEKKESAVVAKKKKDSSRPNSLKRSSSLSDLSSLNHTTDIPTSKHTHTYTPTMTRKTKTLTSSDQYNTKRRYSVGSTAYNDPSLSVQSSSSTGTSLKEHHYPSPSRSLPIPRSTGHTNTSLIPPQFYRDTRTTNGISSSVKPSKTNNTSISKNHNSFSTSSSSKSNARTFYGNNKPITSPAGRHLPSYNEAVSRERYDSIQYDIITGRPKRYW